MERAGSRDGGDPLLYIESIPYWETRGYVMTVLRNYWMYEAQGRQGVGQPRRAGAGHVAAFPGHARRERGAAATRRSARLRPRRRWAIRRPAPIGSAMPIDSRSRSCPVRIAVLTVSDTRRLADDRSGDTLVARLTDAGHVLADRAIVPRRRRR